MNRHIRFKYLYRDASNYKQWGSVIFSNPEHIPIDEIDRLLKSNFEEKCFFIAHQAGLPELFIYDDEPISSEDHCYHEYDSVDVIEQVGFAAPTRSISEFMVTVISCKKIGWTAFDPLENLSRIQRDLP
jgi:hypothetical protein